MSFPSILISRWSDNVAVHLEMLQFLLSIIYPAFPYAAYAPHMSPPHMTYARICRAYDKRTKLTTTAGYINGKTPMA